METTAVSVASAPSSTNLGDDFPASSPTLGPNMAWLGPFWAHSYRFRNTQCPSSETGAEPKSPCFLLQVHHLHQIKGMIHQHPHLHLAQIWLGWAHFGHIPTDLGTHSVQVVRQGPNSNRRVFCCKCTIFTKLKG